MVELKTRKIQGRDVYYRPGTTDEKVLREVIDSRCYRRASVGFDVFAGEHWLDLGANIGAFALYCHINGATCDSYEPEAACFSLMKRNLQGLTGFRQFNCAVTHSRKRKLTLWKSSIESNHYRGTVVGRRGTCKIPSEVDNLCIRSLFKEHYDGVKMDIEGAEFEILDRYLIPQCCKFCMEYHTSRDSDMSRLKRRIDWLKERFDVVNYVPEVDNVMKLGGQQKTFHDRVIYCLKQ